MADDTRNTDLMMDLDPNPEPSDSFAGSVLGLRSLWDELETADGQIEERIRQLAAVTARARLRQTRRQESPPQARNALVEPMYNTANTVASLEGISLTAKFCRRDGTHLVAKALELDMGVKKDVGNGGGFFDCNICLSIASEPILTCCGHLFCWSCFYMLPYVYSTAKECPVCNGEVTDSNIIPIYSNGGDSHSSQLGSALNIPSRPKAHRVESVRQQRVNRGLSHVPVAEALQRIRMAISARGGRSRQQDPDGASGSADRSHQVSISGALPGAEVRGLLQLRARQFSRVLSESAASLSYITSAINDAERLAGDLESHLHNPRHVQINDIDGIIRSRAMIQTENQPVDPPVMINPVATLNSTFVRTDVSAVMQLSNMITDTENGDDITLLPLTSSSSRRIRVATIPDPAGEARELRRRRLS